MRLLLRLAINAVALWAAAYFIPGINLASDFTPIVIVAIIFGLVNALIGPVLRLLSFPLTFITFGLFAIVVNALLLMITAWFSDDRFTINGFLPALLGAIVVSIVSSILNSLLPDKK